MWQCLVFYHFTFCNSKQTRHGDSDRTATTLPRRAGASGRRHGQRDAVEETDDQRRDQLRAQAQTVARPVHGGNEQTERVLRGQGRTAQGRDHVHIGTQRVRRVLFPFEGHQRLPQETPERDFRAVVRRVRRPEQHEGKPLGRDVEHGGLH